MEGIYRKESARPGFPRQSKSLGRTDNYMSWLAGRSDHTENGNSRIAPEITKGDGFGTSSLEGFSLTALQF